MNQSIFGSLSRSRGSSPERPRGRDASSPKPAARPTWSDSTDVALLAILEAPLHPGETAAVGFARKEAELRHILASLSVLESRALHVRLSCPKDGDPLPRAFARMTAERRARLIHFIADARRREALASSK
jgi:hypothetical protein